MYIPVLKLLPALVLASKAALSACDIVEASNVTNVEVTASGWDLRPEADGGCGVGGCDPRLTRDGQDNTVADSRWSCAKGVSSNDECEITFTFDTLFDISYIVLYFHESDEDTEVSIPFSVNYYTEDLTVPGTPLGEGQQVNLPAGEENYQVVIDFDLTNDQWIHLSEVEIFLDVDDPDDIVVSPSPTKYIVDAKTVANVYAYASSWELSSDAGCGEAGCDPRLASDGKNNTVAASRWSCSSTIDTYGLFLTDPWGVFFCHLAIAFDSTLTVSHVIVYLHESDDISKAPMSMEVTGGVCYSTSGCSAFGFLLNDFETVPGTPLGVGHRVNLVEVFVEVTKTDVGIAAREAWNIVTAGTVTTVTPSATGSIDGFGPDMATDGDNNTVATSYWSCNLTAVELTNVADSCALFFEFGDFYTVAYIMLYVHESDDDTRDPIQFIMYDCIMGGWQCEEEEQIGTYVTTPGMALGEGERFNTIRPYTSEIGIWFNTTGRETIDISEVEFFFEVPDGTPTPSPFASPAPTDSPLFTSSTDYYAGSGPASDDPSTTSISDSGSKTGGNDTGSGLVDDSSSITTADDSSSITTADDSSSVTTADDSSSTTTADDSSSITTADDSSSTTTIDNNTSSDEDSFSSTIPPELSADPTSGSKGTKPSPEVFTTFGVAMSLYGVSRAIPLF